MVKRLCENCKYGKFKEIDVEIEDGYSTTQDGYECSKHLKQWYERSLDKCNEYIERGE